MGRYGRAHIVVRELVIGHLLLLRVKLLLELHMRCGIHPVTSPAKLVAWNHLVDLGLHSLADVCGLEAFCWYARSRTCPNQLRLLLSWIHNGPHTHLCEGYWWTILVPTLVLCSIVDEGATSEDLR